jgi:CRISPR/Cas system CSM-associated protein Csm3 (group 7 of RAMP superfamily)
MLVSVLTNARLKTNQTQPKKKEKNDMARRIASRIKVSGTLVAQSPVHVGGIGGNPEVDLALAVNGQGQYYIPGTSLAGAFRSWMQIAENVDNLWGFQEKNDKNGHASFVIVEDAPIQGVDVEMRDGVGIDRVWGTAADRFKYDRAILPRGAKIPLNLTLEVSADFEGGRTQYKTLFASLLKSLENGEIRIGAAKTRGLGRVKLQNLSICESKLCCRDGMLKSLRGDDSKITLDSLLNANQNFRHNSSLTFVINWEPQSPVMVKAEGSGIAVDILPLVSAVENSLTFVLPGSSIKGALRSQAERIVRTVRFLQNSQKVDTHNSFIEQIDIPLVRDLFGEAAKTDKKKPGNIGSLFVDDCYANRPINPTAWGNVEAATNEKNLREALNNANLQKTQQAFHVAVDRWTGGAADGMLYSALELMGITWQPIRLTLDLNRLKDQRLEGIALLLLCLRDLAEGRIPLGYGTNRGMGALKVTSVVINGYNLNDNSLAKLKAVTLPNGSLTELNREILDSLDEAWKKWINNSEKECE